MVIKASEISGISKYHKKQNLKIASDVACDFDSIPEEIIVEMLSAIEELHLYKNKNNEYVLSNDMSLFLNTSHNILHLASYNDVGDCIMKRIIDWQNMRIEKLIRVLGIIPFTYV